MFSRNCNALFVWLLRFFVCCVSCVHHVSCPELHWSCFSDLEQQLRPPGMGWLKNSNSDFAAGSIVLAHHSFKKGSWRRFTLQEWQQCGQQRYMRRVWECSSPSVIVPPGPSDDHPLPAVTMEPPPAILSGEKTAKKQKGNKASGQTGKKMTKQNKLAFK